jgi:hypothetical protein
MVEPTARQLIIERHFALRAYLRAREYVQEGVANANLSANQLRARKTAEDQAYRRWLALGPRIDRARRRDQVLQAWWSSLTPVSVLTFYEPEFLGVLSDSY